MYNLLAYDLTKRMLTINPKDRISIDDAFHHRFIKKYFPEAHIKKIEDNIEDNMNIEENLE